MRVWSIAQSCDSMNCVARQAPLSMGFSRQEYCSGLPCPPPRDRPDRVQTMSPASPAWAGGLSRLGSR